MGQNCDNEPCDPRFQSVLPWSDFVLRRERIYDAIGPNAYALIPGAGPLSRLDRFRQDNEFTYCCGISTPQAYLLLSGVDRSAYLYLPDAPDNRPSGTDSLCTQDSDLICAIAGVTHVCPLDDLWDDLSDAVLIYTPFLSSEGGRTTRAQILRAEGMAAADPWDGSLSRVQHFVSLLVARLPEAELRDLSPLLDALRLTKSAAEVAAIRRAGVLSVRALTEAMRVTRPGRREYHLQAVARFLYAAAGDFEEAYRSVVASGPNAWDPHYRRNDGFLRSGELVLMDTAPDAGGYTADAARMWPVSGTWTPTQAELYGWVLRVHATILDRLTAGVTGTTVLEAVARELGPVVDEIPWSRPSYRNAARRMLGFPGHLAHAVGMATSDPGDSEAQLLSGVLQAGTVLAVDTQMWVPEERLYLRAEDTVHITHQRAEILTADLEMDLEGLASRVGTGGPLDLALSDVTD